MKHMNIIDPTFDANNLGKSVNFNNYHRVKGCLQMAKEDFQQLDRIKENGGSDKEYFKCLVSLF